QRGQVLDNLVYEQYKNQGTRTYIPVPFFISSRGYGLHLATSAYARYDLAASAPDRWSLDVETDPEAPETGIEYDFFVGSPKEIIAAFTSVTAKPALPPEWAFGLWISGNEWNDQATVMEQVRLHAEHQIPASVLVIEAWSDETTFYIWNDARYAPRPPDRPLRYADFTFPPEGKWPNPQAMIDELHARGIKLVLWQIPAMKKVGEPHPQHEADAAYMIEHKYCVQDRSGGPHRIRPYWFRDGLVVDFTRPGAEEWWLSKRAYLVEEMGIDGFKTDGGEHLWGSEFVFADGSRAATASNKYPVLYTGAFYRLATKGGREGLTFSRSGFTGCRSYPCHWAGDENSTWGAFRASILAGLNAGASGIPFWGWDIGGFSGPLPSAELYLRATAMACFCPIMQYHSELNDHRRPLRDRTPWNVQEQAGDPDVIPAFRKYAQLRVRLLPYIYAEARKASESGVPLMRALPIEFPNDRHVLDYPYQYLFGDGLLVAPVVREGATRQEVYLPEGDWIDFWSGERHTGPKRLDVDAPKDVIPVFVAAGHRDLLDYIKG
ncbi:MAG: TIM-barrel domain-containing protein, partial [Nitrososphaerales archaeon]